MNFSSPNLIRRVLLRPRPAQRSRRRCAHLSHSQTLESRTLLSATPNFPVVSTFESGLEGWTLDNPDLGTIDAVDGEVRFTESDPLGVGQFIVAPSKFLGDWSQLNGVGVVAYDHKIIDPGVGNEINGFFEAQLSGPGGFASRRLDTISQVGHLTTESLGLVQSLWDVTGDWSALLADVTDFRIRIESISNSGDLVDVEAIDNVRVEIASHDCDGESLECRVLLAALVDFDNPPLGLSEGEPVTTIPGVDGVTFANAKLVVPGQPYTGFNGNSSGSGAGGADDAGSGNSIISIGRGSPVVVTFDSSVTNLSFDAVDIDKVGSTGPNPESVTARVYDAVVGGNLLATVEVNGESPGAGDGTLAPVTFAGIAGIRRLEYDIQTGSGGYGAAAIISVLMLNVTPPTQLAH